MRTLIIAHHFNLCIFLQIYFFTFFVLWDQIIHPFLVLFL